MDFFEAQDHSRKLSRRLVLLFGAAVLLMIAVVYVAVLLTLGTVTSVAWISGWFQPDVLAIVAGGMLLVIGAGTAFRTAQLRRGGPAVAELLGGRRIHPDTADPAERRLWNVVQEMSIASGTPVPAVYVLDRESGVNAFAAGHTIHDAAVAVTRGTLDTLSRDELQGVVAHEFSHILNGDMRLNLRLMGLLFGILLLAVVGRGALRGSWVGSSRRRRGSGSQVAIIGLVLLILGYLGVFFGRLIQAAVSRQREFLADASAVQFTRNPEGIAGALKKIGGSTTGARIENAHAAEAGHFFFADGVTGALSRAMATHPPLAARIRRLDPRWDGRMVVADSEPEQATRSEAERPSEQEAAHEGRRTEVPGRKAEAPGGPVAAPLTAAAALLASTGTLGPDHVQYARSLLQALPPVLRKALQTPEGAAATVVALVLDDDDRAALLDAVAEALGTETAQRTDELHGHTSALGRAERLPLLDLALPALRELSPARAAALRDLVMLLIRADGRIRSFEFALFHVLRRHLPAPDSDDVVRERSHRSRSLARLKVDAEIVLSALARSGSDSEPKIREAFETGTEALEPGGWRLQPPGAAEVARVDQALGRLEDARPKAKKALLEAAVRIVGADRQIETEEAELLRATGEALGTPIPPVIRTPSLSPGPLVP